MNRSRNELILNEESGDRGAVAGQKCDSCMQRPENGHVLKWRGSKHDVRLLNRLCNGTLILSLKRCEGLLKGLFSGISLT